MKIEGLSAIYKITNPINQIYIGQSGDFLKRMDGYSKLNCENQQLLYKSIKHYGWESHKIELVTYCDSTIIDEVEIKSIKTHDSYYYNNKEFGLNLLEGGRNAIPKNAGRKKGAKNKKPRVSKKFIEMNEDEKKKWIKCQESWKIKVIQYSKEGDFIRIWDSSMEASLFLNLGGRGSSIMAVAKGKKNFKTAGGFQWRIFEEGYPQRIPSLSKNIGLPTPFKIINLKTMEEAVYETVEEFTNKTKISYNSLYGAYNLRDGKLNKYNLQILILKNSSIQFSDKFHQKFKVNNTNQ